MRRWHVSFFPLWGPCVSVWLVASAAACDPASERIELQHAHPEEQCAPGSTRPCYDGPDGSEGVGTCSAGTETCHASGLGWSACEGAVLPEAELCDGSDTNCDGVATCGDIQWARRWGSDSDEILAQLAVDGDANSYAIGYYRGAADIGSGVLPSADDSRKLLIASWDGAGAGRWSHALISAESSTPRSIAASVAGDVVAVGSAAGDIDLEGTIIPGHGGVDAFVVAFDRDGAYRWSARWGDDADQHAESVAFDPTGDIVIAGMFNGEIDLGVGPMVASDSQNDGYVAKLSPSGVTLWATLLAGGSEQRLRSVAVDAQGNIVVAGWFRGTLVVGGETIFASGADDAFVVKLDPNGEVLWTRTFGDPASQQAHAVAVDSQGDVIVAGRFSGSVDFGRGPIDADAAVAMFVVKLDPDGGHEWSERFGGPSHQTVYDLAVDSLDRIIASGYYEGSFGFGELQLPSSGVKEPNLCVLKLTGGGEPIWGRGVRVYGDQTADSAWRASRHVAVAPDDSLLVSGFVLQPIDFGFGEEAGLAGADVFLLRLSP